MVPREVISDALVPSELVIPKRALARRKLRDATGTVGSLLTALVKNLNLLISKVYRNTNGIVNIINWVGTLTPLTALLTAAQSLELASPRSGLNPFAASARNLKSGPALTKAPAARSTTDDKAS